MGRSFRKDLTGEVYGKLTVIGWDRERSYNHEHNFWFCECSCNPEVIVSINGKYMRNGDTQSCGCITSAKPNVYKECDEKTMMLWTTNTNEPFYIDKEDFEAIKKFSWRDDRCLVPEKGYIVTKVNGEVIRLHRFLLDLD